MPWSVVEYIGPQTDPESWLLHDKTSSEGKPLPHRTAAFADCGQDDTSTLPAGSCPVRSHEHELPCVPQLIIAHWQLPLDGQPAPAQHTGVPDPESDAGLHAALFGTVLAAEHWHAGLAASSLLQPMVELDAVGVLDEHALVSMSAHASLFMGPPFGWDIQYIGKMDRVQSGHRCR